MSPTVQSEKLSALKSEAGTAVPFKDSIWRPILSCGGALIIGAALAPLVIQPPKQEAPEPEKRISLRGDQIAIAQATVQKGYSLLEGRLAVSADRAAVATVTGLVARQLADPGDSVKKGQPVVEISVGRAVRPAPAAERQQSAAEQAQVRAAQDQEKLASSIAAARQQLIAAEARVGRAEKRVAAARELIRKIQTGEAPVTRSEPPKTRNRPNESASLAAAQRAQRELAQAEKALATAQAKARQSEQAAKTSTDALKRATANIDKVEAQLEKSTASGADVEAARSAAVDAQDKATAAGNAAFAAKQEVTKLENNVAGLRVAAEKASEKAADDLRAVKVFEEEQAAPAPSTNTVSLAAAAREVEAALAESKAASRVAEQLHNRIDTYDRRVSSSQSRIEAASQELMAAQQRVMDSVPRAQFIPVVAPADGIVAWISPLAREVRPGHAVFGISKGQMLANFEDKSGLWRKLQVGASVPALIPPVTEEPGVQAGSPPGATPTPAAPKGALATLTVTSIEQPKSPTLPVRIRATVKVLDAGKPAVPIRPGMKLLASLSEQQSQTLQIPDTAVLVDEEWQKYVAVLENSDPMDTTSREFEIVWKPVKVAGSKNGRTLISEGLEPGDRIVRTPGMLPKPEPGGEDILAVVES